jgi:hypothetical protein
MKCKATVFLSLQLRLRGILEAGCRWLTPVILATQKAEIRRIVVQSQTQENKKPFTKKGWWSGLRCRL